jgi:hypothetical protein
LAHRSFGQLILAGRAHPRLRRGVRPLAGQAEADSLPGISGRTTVLAAMARGIDKPTALQAALPIRRDRRGMFHKAGEVHREIGRAEAIDTLYELFAEEDARLCPR